LGSGLRSFSKLYPLCEVFCLKSKNLNLLLKGALSAHKIWQLFTLLVFSGDQKHIKLFKASLADFLDEVKQN